ncbi:odorant receptor 4-like [Bicyclus anynana]|uniref:Odorant receptor n=1 Tax=Bicyclus anynana TaxID=110368 RepID=A0A6J1P5L8_BICAN|nr:odorant receptor 4-like [Bicyclus anynana]
MVAFKLSDCFNVNFKFLKIFGVWPGKIPHKYYKYYSALFLSINLVLYNALLILNLVYTPREIELIIREIIFLFTEVTVIGKVLMVVLMQKKLFTVFDILDCEEFNGSGEVKQIIDTHVSIYKKSWKIFTVLGNFSYGSKVGILIIMIMMFNADMELPICKYYFLDHDIVRRYFVFWFIYQSVGMYSHMQYNTNIDTLISGLLYMAIAQVKILKYEIENLRVVNMKIQRRCFLTEDSEQIVVLHKYLKHYEMILKYCSLVQDLIGVTLFIQFGMASIMICVVLCALLLPLKIEVLIFMITYLCALVGEIFVPAWLGTQLTYESGELVSAAYYSEWIPRSERFKRSLKLFMVRANTNIVITGWRIFPLSLDTFTSIMKTAYSFFTLIRNVQDRDEN